MTATSHKLDSTTGEIRTGIITANNIVVGTALSTSSNQTGFGTASPRAKVDIEGSAKFKTYSEFVQTLDISGGNVNINLADAQSFTLSVDADVSLHFSILPLVPLPSPFLSLKIALEVTLLASQPLRTVVAQRYRLSSLQAVYYPLSQQPQVRRTFIRSRPLTAVQHCLV